MFVFLHFQWFPYEDNYGFITFTSQQFSLLDNSKMNVNGFSTFIIETGHKCQNQSWWRIGGDALIILQWHNPSLFSEFLSLEQNENMYNTHVYGTTLT